MKVHMCNLVVQSHETLNYKNLFYMFWSIIQTFAASKIPRYTVFVYTVYHRG